VLFMQGLSLHHAKDRGKAIRAYNDVLDYFGDVIDDAAPALYYLGVAHFDNGDKKKAILAMKEMVEDEDYSQHPLAAGALKRLADNYWANKDRTLAVRYWKQVVADFSASNAGQAKSARHSVYAFYSEENRLAEIASWLLQELPVDAAEAAKQRADIADEVVTVVLNSLHHGKYQQAKYTKSKDQQAAALWKYLSGEKTAFEQSEQTWKYLKTALRLNGRYLKDSKTTDKLLGEAHAFAKAIKDEKKRDQHINQMADFLRDNGDNARAIHTITQHSSANYAAYKKAEYLGRWGKMEEAAEQYKRCESMPDAGIAKSSKVHRANIYRERLNRQDEAIKLYLEIADPPGSLWSLADSYLRKKDYKSAMNTWREIENSFPKDAARAAWYRADTYQKMGENKLAVSEARRVLKSYPKSRESSSAHQLLEAYGIKTGGGVSE
jgi:tetratricopeptide (TPR) repeat protein